VGAIHRWFRDHLGEWAAKVIEALLVLGAVSLVVFVAHSLVDWPWRSNEGYKVTTSVETTTTLGTARERDPQHGTKAIAVGSSAEFFRGDLVVSIGAVEGTSSEERLIKHFVLRVAQGRCEFPAASVGGAYVLMVGRLVYPVQVRAVRSSYGEVVAYRSRTPENSGALRPGSENVACLVAEVGSRSPAPPSP
jgi:hypothetical protein